MLAGRLLILVRFYFILLFDLGRAVCGNAFAAGAGTGAGGGDDVLATVEKLTDIMHFCKVFEARVGTGRAATVRGLGR